MPRESHAKPSEAAIFRELSSEYGAGKARVDSGMDVGNSRLDNSRDSESDSSHIDAGKGIITFTSNMSNHGSSAAVNMEANEINPSAPSSQSPNTQESTASPDKSPLILDPSALRNQATSFRFRVLLSSKMARLVTGSEKAEARMGTERL